MGKSYKLPEKPIFGRTLTLETLEESDADSLNRLIRAAWNPPAPELVPASVKVQFYWPNTRSVEMTSQQISIVKKSRTIPYRWEEVIYAEIWRREHGHHDFHELRVQFLGQQIQFRNGKFWGAPPAAISAYICMHVDRTRVRDFALSGVSQTVQELDARLARGELRLKKLKKMGGIISATFVVTLLVGNFLGGWPRRAIVIALYLPVAHIYRRKACELERHNRELEEQRTQLNTENC